MRISGWSSDGCSSDLLTFHSLSKRSSVPGLRSGFVAGAADLTDAFWRVRLYGGAAPPPPVLAVSAALWSDDAYAAQNRALYRRKYEIAERNLGTRQIGRAHVGKPVTNAKIGCRI